MSRGLVFWVLMIVWFAFMLFTAWPIHNNWGMVGGSVMQFILFGLLGWKVFGPVIHD